MATFKPGDPARFVRTGVLRFQCMIGKSCIVASPLINVDGVLMHEIIFPGIPGPEGPWVAAPDQLEPLKPTDVDDWAREQVKEFTKVKPSRIMEKEKAK